MPSVNPDLNDNQDEKVIIKIPDNLKNVVNRNGKPSKKTSDKKTNNPFREKGGGITNREATRVHIKLRQGPQDSQKNQVMSSNAEKPGGINEGNRLGKKNNSQ